MEEIKIPDIEIVTTNKILIDETNPNKMNKANFEALKLNIKKYGFIHPIITNKEYKIADGFHRWKAARELGLTSIPVIKLEIGEVDRRILRQVLNKLRGQHDEVLDYDEFKFIDDAGAIPELKSLLPEEDFSTLLGETKEDDFDTEKSYKEPKYKIGIGEIWQLGNHRLICGDSTKKDNVEKLMNGKKADLLFTDPPYGINIVKNNNKVGFGRLGFKSPTGSNGAGGIVPVGVYKKIEGDNKPFDPIPFLEYGKNQIFWGGNYFASKLQDSSCWVVWDKRDGLPSNNFADCEIAWTSFKERSIVYHQKWSGLIREGNRTEEMKKRVHPTQKPVGIHKKILNEFTKETEIILDLFGGSGSTLIACEQTNRICHMMEIDPDYCSVIIERWEKLLGKQAVKLTS